MIGKFLGKCNFEQCLLFHCLCGKHNHIFFVKIIILVFLGFIFSIQELQYEDNTLRQFCNPNFDCDKIIKSSAYKRELSLVPFGSTNGSDKTLLNRC